MPTPNTTSSLGDVDKISELENSTLTPTEIKTGIESGKALGEKLAGLDATGDVIDAAIDKVNNQMTAQLDANTAKMNSVNKNDLDLISLLFESGLTAQQIADAIKKSKDITMTAAQIDAAVSKVGLIQDVNSVISGLTVSGREINSMIKLKSDSKNILFNTPISNNHIIYSPLIAPTFTGMSNVTPSNGFKLSFTANTTINSPIITNISSITGLVVGQELYQANSSGAPVPDTIPRGATIISIDSPTQITINKPCLLTSTNKQILATNENIELIGGVVGAYSNNLMVTSSTVGNVTPTQGTTHYAIEFMTDVANINTSTPSIIFGVYQNGITPYNYRIAIDDIYQTTESQPFSTGYVSIQFKSSGTHKVRLELPGLMVIQKVYITNNAKIWKPKQSKPIACFFGDSYFGGTDQTSLWGPQNLAFKIADSMGWKLFNCSVGGTGYISNGSSNYNWQHTKRLDDTLLCNIDVLILFGSINDNGNNQTTARNAYLTTWQGLRNRHPNIPIIIFGVPVTKTATVSSINVLEQGMVEAFNLFGDSNSYLVPITLDITGAWLDVNNVNTYIGADNSHLNSIGVEYISKRMTKKIKEIIGVKDSDIINPSTSTNSTPEQIDNVVSKFNTKADLTYSKNLYNFNSVINGYFMSNTGTSTVSATYCYTEQIAVIPGQTYVGNKDIRFTTYYDKNKILSSTIGSNITISAGTPITIPSNVYYIVLTISISTYDTFQFELGNTPTVFEPYSLGYIKLTKPVKPLETDMFTTTKNLFDKYNKLDGYFINWTTGVPQASATYSCSYFIPVLPNTSYVMSGNGGIKYLAWYDSSAIFISGNQSNSFPLTSPANAAFARVSSLTANISTAQFEAGITATGYSEPYKLKDQYLAIQPSQWNNLKWQTMGDSLTAQLTWQPFVVNKHNVVNYNDGVGGTTISGSGITSFAEGTRVTALDSNADIITIMGGTNDWAQNVVMGTVNDNVVTTFMGALNVLIGKLLIKYPSKRIFFITPPYGELYNFAARGWSNAYTNTLGLTIKDYAEAVKLVCSKYNIPCLDLHSQCGWNTTNIRSFISDDGGLLHPNTLGGEKIGRLVSEFMDRL